MDKPPISVKNKKHMTRSRSTFRQRLKHGVQCMSESLTEGGETSDLIGCRGGGEAGLTVVLSTQIRRWAFRRARTPVPVATKHTVPLLLWQPALTNQWQCFSHLSDQ